MQAKTADEDLEIKFVTNFDISKIKNSLKKMNTLEILKENQVPIPQPMKGDATAIKVFSLTEDLSTEFSIRKIKSDVIANETLEIANYLETICSGKMSNAVISMLPAGGVIPEQKDSGQLHEATRRFHISLISGGVNIVGSSSVRYEEGQCHEINNLKIHHSFNDSNSMRALLILDIVPDSCVSHLLTDPRLKISKNYYMRHKSLGFRKN